MTNPTRLCDVHECGRKHTARGLCAYHWRIRYGKRTTYPITCGTCGNTYRSSRRDGRFCSDACKGAAFRTELRTRSRELVHVGPVDLCQLPARHPARAKAPKPHVWFCGACSWCGDNFTDWQPATRYCSPRCGKQAGRAKAGRFQVPDKVRLSIYERDEWTCLLCLEPVDPDLMTLDPQNDWAPSLDHVVCQSWGEPDHSPSNLRLAHRWCNAVRNDERTYTVDVLRAV